MNTPVLDDITTQQMNASPDPAELIGTVVAHKYRLIESLGSGGMGVVFKAQHILMNKTVAIKMLHPQLIVSEHCLGRFQQEAKAASHINHPNIISVFDFGTTESGQPFIVMDYVRGRSLDDIIQEDGPLAPERCLRIFVQVADALAEAHKCGVIHRDLKPSNVMLVSDGNGGESVRIVDFGIAKIVNSDTGNQLTKTGEIFGSPAYMSPEQCRGNVLDERSDIYSLGCVFYEALSGAPPFLGENMFETMYFHLNKVPVPLCLPPAAQCYRHRVEPIIFKTLEKSRDQRYHSMQQLSSSLRSALRQERWLDSQIAGVKNWLSSLRRHSQDQVHIRMRTVMVAALVLAAAATSAVAMSFLPEVSRPQSPDAPIHFGTAYTQEDAPPLPEDFEAREIAARGPLSGIRRSVDAVESRRAGLAWLQWGDFELKYHLYSQAQKQYSCAFQLAERHPANWLATERSAIAKNLAYCCFCLQDYAKAKEYNLKAIQLALPILDVTDPYLMKPNQQLADIYIGEGNYQTAKRYEEAAYNIMRLNSVSTTSSDYLLCLCDMGEIYYHLGNYRLADNCYDAALKGWLRCNKVQNQSVGYCQYNLALCQSRLTLTQSADANFAAALKQLQLAGAHEDKVSRVRQSYERFLRQHEAWWQWLVVRAKS
ncbi:MAG TPA: serine/threonine-protein kinase [Trichormus sp.]